MLHLHLTETRESCGGFMFFDQHGRLCRTQSGLTLIEQFDQLREASKSGNDNLVVDRERNADE